MYFESSVAINICNLVLQFRQTLVTSVPGTRHGGQPASSSAPQPSSSSSAPQSSSSSSPSSCCSRAVLARGSVCRQPQCQTQPAELTEGRPRPWPGAGGLWVQRVGGCGGRALLAQLPALRSQSRVYPSKATKTVCGLRGAGPGTKHSQQRVHFCICPAHSCLPLKASIGKPTGFPKE